MTNHRFKLIRHYLGLTQHQFAEQFEISYSVVCGIEAGNRPLSDNVESKVAKVFTVTDEFIQFLDNRSKLNK